MEKYIKNINIDICNNCKNHEDGSCQYGIPGDGNQDCTEFIPSSIIIADTETMENYFSLQWGLSKEGSKVSIIEAVGENTVIPRDEILEVLRTNISAWYNAGYDAYILAEIMNTPGITVKELREHNNIYFEDMTGKEREIEGHTARKTLKELGIYMLDIPSMLNSKISLKDYQLECQLQELETDFIYNKQDTLSSGIVENLEEFREYGINDVKATRHLWNNQFKLSQNFNARVSLIQAVKIHRPNKLEYESIMELLSRSDSQFLGSMMTQEGVIPQKYNVAEVVGEVATAPEFNNHLKIINENINKITKIKLNKYISYQEKKKQLELYKTDIIFKDSKGALGFGGIHLTNDTRMIFGRRHKANKSVYISDMTSQYPSMMINNSKTLHNVDCNLIKTFKDLRAKDKKSPLAPGMKLAINSTYGLVNAGFETPLTNPKGGVVVTLTGNKLILEYLEYLEMHGLSYELIQANTDGVYLEIDTADTERADNITKIYNSKNENYQWESEVAESIFQLGVNDYVIDYGNQKYKEGGKLSSSSIGSHITPNPPKTVSDIIKRDNIGNTQEIKIYPIKLKVNKKMGYYYITDRENGVLYTGSIAKQKSSVYITKNKELARIEEYEKIAYLYINNTTFENYALSGDKILYSRDTKKVGEYFYNKFKEQQFQTKEEYTDYKSQNKQMYYERPSKNKNKVVRAQITTAGAPTLKQDILEGKLLSCGTSSRGGNITFIDWDLVSNSCEEVSENLHKLGLKPLAVYPSRSTGAYPGTPNKYKVAFLFNRIIKDASIFNYIVKKVVDTINTGLNTTEIETGGGLYNSRVAYGRPDLELYYNENNVINIDEYLVNIDTETIKGPNNNLEKELKGLSTADIEVEEVQQELQKIMGTPGGRRGRLHKFIKSVLQYYTFDKKLNYMETLKKQFIQAQKVTGYIKRDFNSLVPSEITDKFLKYDIEALEKIGVVTGLPSPCEEAEKVESEIIVNNEAGFICEDGLINGAKTGAGKTEYIALQSLWLASKGQKVTILTDSILNKTEIYNRIIKHAPKWFNKKNIINVEPMTRSKTIENSLICVSLHQYVGHAGVCMNPYKKTDSLLSLRYDEILKKTTPVRKILIDEAQNLKFAGVHDIQLQSLAMINQKRDYEQVLSNRERLNFIKDAVGELMEIPLYLNTNLKTYTNEYNARCYSLDNNTPMDERTNTRLENYLEMELTNEEIHTKPNSKGEYIEQVYKVTKCRELAPEDKILDNMYDLINSDADVYLYKKFPYYKGKIIPIEEIYNYAKEFTNTGYKDLYSVKLRMCDFNHIKNLDNNYVGFSASIQTEDKIFQGMKYKYSDFSYSTLDKMYIHKVPKTLKLEKVLKTGLNTLIVCGLKAEAEEMVKEVEKLEHKVVLLVDKGHGRITLKGDEFNISHDIKVTYLDNPRMRGIDLEGLEHLILSMKYSRNLLDLVTGDKHIIKLVQASGRITRLQQKIKMITLYQVETNPLVTEELIESLKKLPTPGEEYLFHTDRYIHKEEFDLLGEDAAAGTIKSQKYDERMNHSEKQYYIKGGKKTNKYIDYLESLDEIQEVSFKDLKEGTGFKDKYNKLIKSKAWKDLEKNYSYSDYKVGRELYLDFIKIS